MKPADRIIVALDCQNELFAEKTIVELHDNVSFFKVGQSMFLYYKFLIKCCKYFGCKVFLDLKLWDIPNTVGRTVDYASRMGVDFLTIGYGTEDMIKAAVEAKGDKMKLLCVPSLTTEEFRCPLVAIEQFKEKSIDAVELGVDGIVCSGFWVSYIRDELPNTTIVCPGIRTTPIEGDDQKGVATPKEAVENGADYLVIGRPIINSKDMVGAVKKICSEIS